MATEPQQQPKNGNGSTESAEDKARADREKRELALREAEMANAERGHALGVFSGQASFVGAQRIAQALASSSLVPKEYQKNVPNCLIAMELASRVGASVLMVMQNLYIVHGRPGWSSSFLIATINSCGKFDPLDYEWSGEEGTDSWGCRAFTKRIGTDKVLRGAKITVSLAKSEGWYSRNGSKWQTEMQEQMLMYRSAAFWSRTYAPEISLGMHTAEEVVDMTPASAISATPADLPAELSPGSTDELEAALRETPEHEVVDAETGEVIVKPAETAAASEPPPEREPGEDDDPGEEHDGTLPGLDAEPKRGKRGR